MRGIRDGPPPKLTTLAVSCCRSFFRDLRSLVEGKEPKYCRDGASPVSSSEALPRRGKPRLYGNSDSASLFHVANFEVVKIIETQP